MRSFRLPKGVPGLASLASGTEVILVLALWGCGGGGGGGSAPAGSGDERNGSVSQVTEGDLGDGRIEVQFTLRTPTSKKVGVDIDYSEDRGLSFTRATLEAAPRSPGALPSSPEGVRHTMVWRISSDVQDRNQHDFCLQVSPYDTSTGRRGIAGRSPVFGFGDNNAPVIADLSTPSGVKGGWIDFSYTVSDPEGDHVGIAGEFSLDGGATWGTASLGEGDGAESVTAAVSGTAHGISWNAQGDAPGRLLDGVRLRLWAIDTAPGPSIETGGFSIDTNGPSVDLLSIDEISREMNGSVPFTDTSGRSQAFTLLAPEWGFEISVLFTGGGSAIDPSSLAVRSSAPLGGGSAAGGADAGQDFGGNFQVDTQAGLARLVVPQGLRFPAGLHTITASLSDLLGNFSDAVSFTFETKAATPDHLPFDHADRWLLDFTRDNFTITSSANGQGTVLVSATRVANGVPDFIEDLRILGLQSASPPEPAASAGLNQLVLLAVEEAVMGRLNEMYGRHFDGSSAPDGAAIGFTLTAPSPPFSRIGIGGDDVVPGYTIGRAEFDYRNSAANDDSDSDLGIFTTNLIDFYINASYTFRSRFNPLIPGRGVPLGFDPLDVTVLGVSFDRNDPGNTAQENGRYDNLDLAIDAIARVTATILAHEIGHSVGLVANSAPPAGLFGGEFMASFAGPYTNTYHLDTGDNEIMASAIGFSDAITAGPGGPRFNKLTMAYLLERMILE